MEDCAANRLRNKRLLLGCALIFCLRSFSIQAQYRFESWTTDTGLPQNTIRAIQQTKDGYLWFATDDGLARFDGFRFVVFDSSNSPGFCCNRLMNLYEDSDGTLWIATAESSVISYRKGKFASFTTHADNPNGNLLISTGAGSLVGKTGQLRNLNTRSDHYYLDRANALWYSTPGKLFRSKDGKEEAFVIPVAFAAKSFYEDSSNNLWVGARGVLMRIRDGLLKVFEAKDGLPQTNINAIAEDRNGNIWAGTDEGLCRLENDKFRIYTTSDGLSSKTIQSLFLDRDGTLWIGTADQGVNKLLTSVISIINPNESIYPVFEDQHGTIWMGNWLREGLSTYKNEKLERVKDGGQKFVLPLAFAEDREGRLWIGALAGAWWYKDGRFSDFRNQLPKEATGVHAIVQDRKGVLWFGTDHGLVKLDRSRPTLYTTKDGLAYDEVKSLLEDRQGQLWIGTNGGLSRLSEGRFVSYTKKDGLGSEHIRDVYEDQVGTLWIGTLDGGLSRMKDGSITTTYRTNDGLFAKGVFRILDDQRGNFWMTSNRGIYRVSKQQLEDFAAGKVDSITSVPYGRNEGMVSAECNGGSQPAGVLTRDDKLLVPTQSGVAMIDLRHANLNQQPPQIVVEGVKLNGRPLNLDERIELPYNSRNLEIQYVGLSSIKPESVRYRYKLEGYDSDWVEAGTRRVAPYPRLPPGRYTFTLAAANSDGVWSTSEHKFALVVAGPFWNSWWFVLSVVLALLGIFYTIYRLYILKLERNLARQHAFSRQLIESQETERGRIARELHDDVVQRLASLGISTFNLNERVPENLRGQVGEIYDRTIEVTDDLRKLSHSLHPTVLRYVGLVPAIRSVCDEFRSHHNVAVDLVVDKELKTFNDDIDLCLYRIVQQGLTNVAQHASATSVLVSLLRSGPNIDLIISDDGKGFDRGKVRAKKGLGLLSLEERVSALGGEFVINSRNGSGTEITVSIPHKPGREER